MNRYAAALLAGLLCASFAVRANADEKAKARLKARVAIEQVYMDCLGREPTPADVTAWQNALRDGKDPREVRAMIISGPECGSAITRMFNKSVKRAPNEKEMLKARKHLNEGGSLDELQHKIDKKMND